MLTNTDRIYYKATMNEISFIHKLQAQDLKEAIYQAADILGVVEGVRAVIWAPDNAKPEVHPSLWISPDVKAYTAFSERMSSKPDLTDGEYGFYVQGNQVASKGDAKNISCEAFSRFFSHSSSGKDLLVLSEMFNSLSWDAQVVKGPVAEFPHYDATYEDDQLIAGQPFLGQELGILVTRQGESVRIYEGRDEMNPGPSVGFSPLTYVFFLRSFGESSKLGLLHSSPDFKVSEGPPRIADSIFATGLKPR